jgi:hypothetical protein
VSKNGKPILSESAIAHGREHASALFEGRRGHGGKSAGRVLISRAELEDNFAISYQVGAQTNAMMAKARRS